MAPSRTPANIVTRLNRDVADIRARTDIRQRLAALGFVPLSTTPDAFRKLVQEEHVRWGTVIREAGLKLDGGPQGRLGTILSLAQLAYAGFPRA